MSESGGIQSEETFVVSFDDAKATNRALVGGKGANLARLVGAGLPVPEGFCVTTVVYKALIDEPSIQEAIHELAALDPTDTTAIADAGATLRTQIETRDMPEEIRNAIESALDENADGSEQTYAVRSSATAEDLPEASFAGQQETFLNVRMENITDRVRACMTSLFTDRAIAYRTRSAILHGEVAIAVVVQRMASPDVSGILFTADPRSGSRNVAVIEAGHGLGEGFVSGEVPADTIHVDKRTGEMLDYESSGQEVAVRLHPEGGTETIELAPDERASRILSDEQARTLAELGTTIEAIFESPQDIEWCLANGEFSIVQARPITSLFPVPTPEPTDDDLHIYISLGHRQAFADAVPPLVRDIWMTYVQMGFSGLGSNTQWAAEAGGRVYMDVTKMLRISLLRDLLPDQLAANSPTMSTVLEDLLDRRGDEFRIERSLNEMVAAAPTLTPVAWSVTKVGLSLLLPTKRQDSVFSGFLGAFIGEPTPPASEEAKWETWGENIAESIRTSESPTERSRTILLDEVIDFPPAGSMVAAFTAGEILEKLFPDAPEDVNAIGKGFPDDVVTRINLGLGDLTDVARAHPAVADALRQNASLEEIESVADGGEFVTALEEYLDEFGHRATGEIDISRPRWREDPSVLLATVRANLEHGEAGEHRKHVKQMEREAIEATERLEQRANHGVLGPIRKRLVRRLIRTYRGYIVTREFPKQGLAHVFTAWRVTLHDAGETLAEEGQLNSAEDVWFLWKEELFTTLDGEPINADIAARRAEFERFKSLDAPPVLTSEGEAPSATPEREGVPEGALVGTGVSGGVVEGVARVVHDPTEETIENGEILIAPSSDPGWTPLFLNAAGIVVEVGGRLSHGALVAREYGLPAVVSVPDATRRIETGQRVRIDGTQGTVEIIEDNNE